MIAYLLTFIIMILSYAYTVKIKKNIINLPFFQLIGSGLMVILPNIIFMAKQNYYFNLRIGDYYQLFYIVLLYIITVLIELKKINIKFEVPNFENKKIGKKFFLFISLILLIYIGCNFNLFLKVFENPRLFYASMRIGGGFIYYILIPLIIFCYFYFISHFNSRSVIEKIVKYFISTLFVCLIIYFFGQKGPLLTIGYLCLTTIMFRSNSKNKNVLIIIVGMTFLCMGLLFFSIYSKQQNIKYDNVLDNIVAYSDYIRNFNDLVDNLDHHYYGKIFFEDEVYSYIPRAIWHNKPELFGSLGLGLNVPRLVEWTLKKTGAPSFGVIGAAYADFGIVGIILKLLFESFIILIAKKYEEKIESEYNFWHHFIFLMFIGIKIFSITLTTIPIYQIVIILILYNWFTEGKKDNENFN